MNNDFEVLIEKAIVNAPDWLSEDLENIMNKTESPIRESYIVTELFKRYTFGIKHITSAMNRDSEWSQLAHDRLNFIDNNLDLIQYMVKKLKAAK
ncbi:hypothetical protein [Bacillus dakarensis]|uniref:hypothetical protein n=1 Tax=Robertmurraya dakarensis TaxID=1926278 RepID=UPI000980BAB5|nr:hypothetical protein [Bacillus dakarensis]